jgi:hypothetical protein
MMQNKIHIFRLLLKYLIEIIFIQMPGMGISRAGNLYDKNYVPPLLFVDNTQGLRTKRKSLTQTMQSPKKKKQKF